MFLITYSTRKGGGKDALIDCQNVNFLDPSWEKNVAKAAEMLN